EMVSLEVQAQIVNRCGGETPKEVDAEVLRGLLPGLDSAGKDHAFVTRLIRRLEPASAAADGSSEGSARLTGVLSDINAMIHGVKAAAAESPARINYSRCVSEGPFLPTGARFLRFVKDGREVITVSKTGTLQRWDARTQAPIGKAQQSRLTSFYES